MKTSHNAWVRQDRIFWVDEIAGIVRYKFDKDDKNEVEGSIQDVVVWAPMSTRKLADLLGERLEKQRERIFTYALREWQVTNDCNVATTYLTNVIADINLVMSLD